MEQTKVHVQMYHEFRSYCLELDYWDGSFFEEGLPS